MGGVTTVARVRMGGRDREPLSSHVRLTVASAHPHTAAALRPPPIGRTLSTFEFSEAS